MKRLLLLFIPLVFFFSCKKNNEEIPVYSCVQNECVYAYNGLGQQIHEPTYVSLEDCLNDCLVE